MSTHYFYSTFEPGRDGSGGRGRIVAGAAEEEEEESKEQEEDDGLISREIRRLREEAISKRRIRMCLLIIVIPILTMVLIGLYWYLLGFRSSSSRSSSAAAGSNGGEVNPSAQELLEFGSEFRNPSVYDASSNAAAVALLVLNVTRLQIKIVGVDRVDLTMNCRVFNGSIVGPTIETYPGSTLKILLRNDLGPYHEEIEEVPPGNFRYANSTVIHPHGLHVSPSGLSDNMFTGTVLPGKSRLHIYEIPANHPRGTYFIHPHYYGSSTLQVSTFSTSALIVKDLPNEMNPDFAEMKDYTLVVHNFNLGTGKTHDIIEANRLAKSDMDLQITSSQPLRALNKILVNGVSHPFIRVHSKDWTRLRVIHAGTDGLLILKMINDDFSRHDSCRAWIIARDGVYMKYPRFLSSTLVMSPGSRADILFQGMLSNHRCHLRSDSEQYGTTKFSNWGEPSKILVGTVLTINVIPDDSLHSNPDALRPIPVSPLNTAFDQDLSLLPLNGEPFILKWSTFAAQPNSADPGHMYPTYGVNGHKFDPSDGVVIPVKIGQLQEWIIVNSDSENHPFHMHTNHFQVVDSSIGNNYDYYFLDYRDTISIPGNSNVTIRWIPKDYTGLSMVHCHIFSHEDTGMVAAILIEK